MLILGINGSPKKEENTFELLNAALEPARSRGAATRIINVTDALRGVAVPFCNNCSAPCSGKCFQDNSLGEAFDLMGKADGIIVGSPVYFGTVSGQLKGFWDKTRYLRSHKLLLNVVGGAVTVAASRYGGQETTIRAIHDMMLVQGMTVVGDGYRGADAGHHGGCAQRPSTEDETGLRRAHILGQRVLELAEVTKGLRLR